jgi:hypothetical protein
MSGDKPKPHNLGVPLISAVNEFQRSQRSKAGNTTKEKRRKSLAPWIKEFEDGKVGKNRAEQLKLRRAIAHKMAEKGITLGDRAQRNHFRVDPPGKK